MDALGIGSDSQTTEEWEAEAWKSLRNAVQTLKKRVDIISQAYTEAVSVRQSIVSNQQAEQVGYLTSLAVLFVPASFVASIFSMGGDFSAGADRFWVFWAILVPLVMLSCIFLFTKLGERIWSSLRQYYEYGRKEESPV
jgi:Mg2+ and Co2+ transporter CorA